jgi:hypothetical protein
MVASIRAPDEEDPELVGKVAYLPVFPEPDLGRRAWLR